MNPPYTPGIPPKNSMQATALFFRERLKSHYGKQLVVDLAGKIPKLLLGGITRKIPTQGRDAHESCGKALLPPSQSWKKAV